MQKLYFFDEDIEKVLRQIECQYSYIPVVAYVRLYEKYKSLVDDENILHELEKYFQNMFICDDEEYLKNQRRFIEVFNELTYHLPRGYDYEFSNARELKKR